MRAAQYFFCKACHTQYKIQCKGQLPQQTLPLSRAGLSQLVLGASPVLRWVFLKVGGLCLLSRLLASELCLHHNTLLKHIVYCTQAFGFSWCLRACLTLPKTPNKVIPTKLAPPPVRASLSARIRASSSSSSLAILLKAICSC